MEHINKIVQVQKKELTGNGLQKCYKTNLVKKDEKGMYLSLYSDEQTIKGVVTAIARLKQAFPALEDGFYNVLTDRVKEKGLTDNQFMDAINYVIDTCEYPTPVIGKFLSYDKKQRLYTYNEISEFVHKGENMDYFEIKEVNGKKWWVRKA